MNVMGLLFLFFLIWSNSLFASDNWLSQMTLSKEKSHVIPKVVPTQSLAFFKSHALVLFYASTCPHCHQFAPTLKQFARENKAHVLALSLDNKALSDFPTFLPATTEWINVAFKGQAITYPALFIVNEDTKNLYPVSIGSMSGEELTARMNSLIPKIKSYERGVL